MDKIEKTKELLKVNPDLPLRGIVERADGKKYEMDFFYCEGQLTRYDFKVGGNIPSSVEELFIQPCNKSNKSIVELLADGNTLFSVNRLDNISFYKGASSIIVAQTNNIPATPENLLALYRLGYDLNKILDYVELDLETGAE